jgi:hypothetical protein
VVIVAALLLVALCVTVLCFVQAARIQRRWAVDGVLRGAKFSTLRLWVLVGAAFGVAAFFLFIAIVNPLPASMTRP